ncbi:MAG: hypothetical protein OXM01_10000 [Gemmatimonadota bacterium]|nr:hypothetical protein [Gemmatimonadota bacterium]
MTSQRPGRRGPRPRVFRKLYWAVRDTPVSFAMAVLQTPSSRKRRRMFVLAGVEPGDTQRALRGRSSFRRRGPDPAEALSGALGDQVALDLGEQRE